ncbi:MAG TPA: heparin lyase I family protein [Polyangia bacterium]
MLLGCALFAPGACDRRVDLGEIGDGASSLLWSATFEPGNLSEWMGDGHGGLFNENINIALVPSTTTTIAHGGHYAGLVTLSPTAGMTSTNYLFRNAPTPTAAYYSAWFYIPSSVTVGTWLSLTHFRGSQTGDGNNLSAIWDVNLYPLPDGSLAAQLFDYAGQKNTRQPTPVPVLFDTWVQFEVHFVKATDATGRIEVYQDGTLILERVGLATVTNDWLQWDAGGACDALSSSPATVYLDDATISTIPLAGGS